MGVLDEAPLSGEFTYQDPYGQLYVNRWEWNRDRTILDATVVVEQPYVWGQPSQSQFRGRNLYKMGVVTVCRTVIQKVDGGYILVASGSSQYVDWVRVSFHCSPIPVDPFRYHLDQQIVEELELVITDGPAWAGPDLLTGYLWSDPDLPLPTDLIWVDVWSN